MLKRIRTEALNLMNEKGINFTIADLAKQLGVSKRSIYDHFSSKVNLIEAVLNEILSDLQVQIQEIVNSQQLNTIDKLSALLTASPKALGPLSSRVIVDIKRKLPEQWNKFEYFFDARWQEIEKIIELGIEQKQFRTFDMRIVQQMYRGSINELYEYQFLTQSNQTFQNAIAAMTDILIFGFIATDNRQPSN
jgi:AcrR family transcriptional regulator